MLAGGVLPRQLGETNSGAFFARGRVVAAANHLTIFQREQKTCFKLLVFFFYISVYKVYINTSYIQRQENKIQTNIAKPGG